MGRIECRKQREPRRDEDFAVSYKEATSSCDDGAETSESVVVPVGHFENGEPPDAPASMALSCALGEMFVEQGVRAETHDDEQVGRWLISEIDALEHD